MSNDAITIGNAAVITGNTSATPATTLTVAEAVKALEVEKARLTATIKDAEIRRDQAIAERQRAREQLGEVNLMLAARARRQRKADANAARWAAPAADTTADASTPAARRRRGQATQ